MDGYVLECFAVQTFKVVKQNDMNVEQQQDSSQGDRKAKSIFCGVHDWLRCNYSYARGELRLGQDLA